MDDVSVNQESALEDLVSLWQRRRAEGEPATPAELCRERPELLPELERRLAVLERMNALAGAAHGTATLDTAGSLQSTATAPPFVGGDSTAAASLPVTMDLRGYELIEPLGKGGMGEVYRSCDPALHRDLAIKVMAASLRGHAEGERRFLREARITGSLQHPGIVAVYNLGRLADGRLHYTMRLVRGRTLADILKEEAGQAERMPSLLAIFEKVCEAVAYAHSKRVIHRDLKPGNIMVGKFGEVQVMDWGLAKLLSAEGGRADMETAIEAGGTLIHTEAADTPSDLTRAGSGIGTPEYMPPEQAQGDWQLVDERADVFALGAILCLILTGRSPYSGSDGMEVLRRARRGDLAEALARLEQCGGDAALKDLCRECMAVERQQRPRDAGEVARRVAEHRVVVEQRLRQAELQKTEAEVTTREERKRRRLALGLSAAVVLVLAAGIVVSSLFAVDARHQAGDAIQAKREADDNAKRAEEQERTALQQKRQADEARERAEWLLYASQIALAHREWQDGADVQHARDLLDACRWDYGGWEHAYLRHLFDETQQTFYGNTHGVLSVAFSPDGKRLASGSRDKTVKIWDTATGQEILTLKRHAGTVYTVAFSPDGKRLASGSEGNQRDREPGEVKVWDTITGQEILTLKGHAVRVNSLAFSPDGKLLASSGWGNWAGDEPGEVKVWDAATGQEVLNLKGHTRPVSSVAFSPDGKQLASGSSDAVKIWDLVTGQEALTLKGLSVTRICFSPDSTRLAGASAAGADTLKVWDATSGQELLTLRGGNTSVAFSPDGQRLATGSYDGKVKVWDAATGQQVLNLKGHSGSVYSVCFSPDGERLASGGGDGTVKIWDVSMGQDGLTLRGYGTVVVAFSPDGKQLAGGSDDKTAKVWDAATGREVLNLKGHTAHVTSVAFSPDGKRLASGVGGFHKPGEVKVWDTATGQEVLSLKEHSGYVWSVCFSPDVKRLASGSGDSRTGEVKLWDLATGQEVLTLKGYAGRATSVVFSPDGKHLASGSDDGTVKVWDTITGQEILTLKGHAKNVNSVAFSPDGKRLASSSLDKTVRLWNEITGQEILALKGHSYPIAGVAFSPDGKRLAGGWFDGVKLWETATGQEVLILKGHDLRTSIRDLRTSISSVAFSPDGRRLAGGANNGEVRVWDSTLIQETFTLKGNSSAVSSVGFSPDGKRIITQTEATLPGSTPVVRAWDAATGAEVSPCTDPPPRPGCLQASSPNSRMKAVVVGGTVEVRRDSPFTVDPVERRRVEARKALFWHQQQVETAEKRCQWFAANFHLNWLFRTDPKQAFPWLFRGRIRLKQGRPSEAATDIRRALQLEPKNLDALRWQALLCLAVDDHAGYRHACADLQNALSNNSDPSWARYLAYACTLAPDALADWKPLLQRTEKLAAKYTFADSPNSCLGRVLLRAGRHQEAIEHLRRVLERRPKNVLFREEELLLALAYHHLGKHDEARRWLTEAVAWQERGQGPVRASSAVAAGTGGPLAVLAALHSEAADPRTQQVGWEQRLNLQLLRCEAEQLLGPKGR